MEYNYLLPGRKKGRGEERRLVFYCVFSRATERLLL